MKEASKYVVVALCGLMILVACTAGCTSSTTSPSPQASTSAQTSTASSDKFTKAYDAAGSDPDQAVLPRYEPSVRVISPSNHSTGWVYETKDSWSSVKAFYAAQISKLGYSNVQTSNNTNGWSVSFAKGNTSYNIAVAGPNSAQAKYDEFNFTTISMGPTGGSV